MCKVSEVGAGARVRIGRGREDVPAEVTEEVKLLVVEVLLLLLLLLLLLVVMVRGCTAHDRRLWRKKTQRRRLINKHGRRRYGQSTWGSWRRMAATDRLHYRSTEGATSWTTEVGGKKVDHQCGKILATACSHTRQKQPCYTPTFG